MQRLKVSNFDRLRIRLFLSKQFIIFEEICPWVVFKNNLKATINHWFLVDWTCCLQKGYATFKYLLYINTVLNIYWFIKYLCTSKITVQKRTCILSICLFVWCVYVPVEFSCLVFRVLCFVIRVCSLVFCVWTNKIIFMFFVTIRRWKSFSNCSFTAAGFRLLF